MTTHPIRRTPTTFDAPATVDRLQKLGLIAGVLGLVLSAIGFFLSQEYFYRGYLVGWVLWTGVSLGSLAFIMVGHLSGGDWAVVSRRIFEAATRVLPVMAALFIPVLAGAYTHRLYEWADPEAVKHDEILRMKQPYLNLTGFTVRWLIYFAIWIGLSWYLANLTRRQDAGGDLSLIHRAKVASGPGLIVYCLTVTLASVDWLMSLQPHWFSTIYGIYLIGSQGLAALAFLIIVASRLSRTEPMNGVLQPRHFHDWGKLMFAFVMLWTYFSWSQFLITWAGNLPEEISFYLPRIRGGFGWVAILIVLFHFAVPFALLLSRDLKRHAGRVAVISTLLLFMRWVELFWQVEPAFHGHHAPALYWLYVAGPLAVGGFWLFFFARNLKSRPLLPIQDPYLPEAIAHGHQHH